MIDFHTEEVDVELSRTGEIFDVKDDVVDTRNFERRSHNPPPCKYRRKIRNPNIEIRNKLKEKYISYRENPKHRIERKLVWNFVCFLNIWICFEFRIWEFICRILVHHGDGLDLDHHFRPCQFFDADQRAGGKTVI